MSFFLVRPVLAALAVAIALPALAQQPQQFVDPKTGKVWTPDNVGTGRSTEPPTPADRAFDPQGQASVARDGAIQAPNLQIVGSVPIPAGPNVPIAVIDTAELSVTPGQRWQVTLIVANNSGGMIAPVIDCTFLNSGNPVQNARANLPTVSGGQRVGLVIYGPPSDLFVDRSECRLVSP